MTINGIQVDVELIIACVVVGVWLIRQEGRITRSAERILEVEKRLASNEGLVSTLNSDITKSLHHLELAVARIETKLAIQHEKEVTNG